MKTRSLSLLVVCSLAACGGASKSAESPAAATPAKVGEIPDGNMPRTDVPDEFKWNLTAILADDAAFTKGLAQSTAMRADIDGCRGQLGDPARLASCLDLYFNARLLTNKLTLYANLGADTDITSPERQDMAARALAAMKALMTQAAFFRKEILAYDEAALAAAFQSQPRLAELRPYFDEILRRRNNVLGEEAERVLNLAGDNQFAEIDLNEIPSDFESTFGGLMADLPMAKIEDDKGQTVQMTMSNYPVYRGSDKRSVRRAAVEAFFGTLKQFEHVFAGLFAGQVRYSISLARSRGYATALDAYMHKDNIDPAIYKNLISSVEANLAPLHRYVALRKRLMKVDELHIYDLYTPLVAGVKKEVPYSEAQRLIPEALAALGPDYIATLKLGLDPKEGWIDIYPHKNKGAGAFSASVFGVHPYVKMNYYNELDDLSTLAHEYGHALHTHLAMNKQPYVSANYVPIVAETASTFNQKLLSDYLLAHAATDAEKLYILNDLVETIRTTIYRQTLFAAFELAAHTAAENGTTLTAKFLNQTYSDLVRKYYGPDFTLGENDGYEWAYVHHFYYKFYMWSYAMGLSSGIALAELVQKGGPEARDAYLGMLAGGASKPPRELFMDAGIDVTKPTAIEAAARLMDSALTQMEGLLAK